MEKGTKVYSILKNKCPRCMEAPFFASNNQFNIQMNQHCAHCNLDFNHEPGFYIGAMYVSYAQGVAVALVTGLILFFGWGLSFNYILIGIAAMLVLTSPINFRLSRLIWINIWVSYKAESGLVKK